MIKHKSTFMWRGFRMIRLGKPNEWKDSLAVWNSDEFGDYIHCQYTGVYEASLFRKYKTYFSDEKYKSPEEALEKAFEKFHEKYVEEQRLAEVKARLAKTDY